jgi:hypothetical protein
MQSLGSWVRDVSKWVWVVAAAVVGIGVPTVAAVRQAHAYLPRLSVAALAVALVGSFRAYNRERQKALASPTAIAPTPQELAVVIERETPHPMPGVAMILEVDFSVTNHDGTEHLCRLKAVSSDSLYFGPEVDVPRQRYAIEERRRNDLLPSRVRSGETVRGFYVGAFNWDPTGRLPSYDLQITDGWKVHDVRPERPRRDRPPAS